MAQVDFNERQLTIKLVYYGPPLSGKTTNLRWIHSRVSQAGRGRLMTLETKDDRTLFFDLLPIFFQASGLSFRVKVYTVPGQPMHEATRRIVLKATDGVAFVADSQRSQLAANEESYRNLLDNLQRLGLTRRPMPIIVQYNKRDLPDILDGHELPQVGRADAPWFTATAIRGDGVLETFFALLSNTWDSIDANVGITKNFGIDREAFLAAVRRHVTEGPAAG